jgi:AraC family ethanolamine operon transcriptional activator
MESAAPAPARAVRFAAGEPADYDEAAKLLGWNIRTFGLQNRFRAGLTGAQTGSLQVARVDAATAHIACGEAPRDCYVLVLARRMKGLTTIRGEAIHDKTVGVINPDTGFEFQTAGTDLLLLSMSRQRMEEATRALWGTSIAETGDVSTLVFQNLQTSATRAASWFARIETLLHAPKARVFERAAREIEERLLEDLLVAVAPPERPFPGVHRRKGARRAEAFIQAHWRDSISLADLCRAAGSPDRDLRRAFGELYGASPMVYLRTVRLQAAREELRRTECERSISEVALGRGFTHLGRFSVDYRRAFGETPSQTLNRRSRVTPFVELHHELAFDHFRWR